MLGDTTEHVGLKRWIEATAQNRKRNTFIDSALNTRLYVLKITKSSWDLMQGVNDTRTKIQICARGEDQNKWGWSAEARKSHNSMDKKLPPNSTVKIVRRKSPSTWPQRQSPDGGADAGKFLLLHHGP